ncbi:D-aminoacyl-tRNA deacylase [Camellia lanceoleosa]|uniref:D-aminoacyl-tRNA deacylase n=1 Tax=Camellia lanceoleosa TaxID=1840588 RepID=A0ACC0FCI5_9ERIC|nr:D-aminoacyl-tRNA deacylase [Camellia lanceoleosa]
MVTLVVATTIDLTSIGPASALLSMPDTSSFTNRAVRLLKRDKSIVREDHLDKRWEEATGEVVDEVIFLSKHRQPQIVQLTVHQLVCLIYAKARCHLQVETRWAAPPNPQIGPWLRLLKAIAESHNLTPEFELVWEGLGLGGGAAVGDWSRNNGQSKILLGIGGGHYAPWHMDIVLQVTTHLRTSKKGHVWVGHLLSGYSLPMEDLGQSKQTNVESVGGTWKAIKVATKADFQG